MNVIWMILKARMQTVEDKTVVSGLCQYASDWYGLLIMVGGVSARMHKIQCPQHQILNHYIVQSNFRNVNAILHF